MDTKNQHASLQQHSKLHSLNVAIEKKVGIRTLEKLRTIHLLEADYNTGTKHIFSNRAMHNALIHKQIPESQYMKRHSSAIEAVLLKRLFFDVMLHYIVVVFL